MLEEQPPRCKAQFIVNAVLHYINCPETPDISLAQSVDKESIRTIVLEILRQQGIEQKKEKTMEEPVQQRTNLLQSEEKVEQEKNVGGNGAMDHATLSLIADTLSAFRGN